MEYSEKARIFLARHGMEPERVELEAATAAFIGEMELGLAGRESSLKMIPTYLTAAGQLPEGRTAAVIDAGGTNFRTALVTFTPEGPVIDSLRVTPMPGSEAPVSWDTFIGLTADRLLPLLEKTDTVGFCFSYPTEETPERDGRIIKLTKQVVIEGFEGRLICADLKAALAARGAESTRIVLLNDTPAVLLSGAALLAGGGFDSLVGLIAGTGVNTCCDLPVSAVRKLGGVGCGRMLINLESGSFDRLPRGDYDAELDAATVDPGTYRHEKMTSGGYCGELCRLTLRGAARDGLFTDGGAAAALALDRFPTPDADALSSGKTCGPFADAANAALAGELCRAIFERAARCICCNLSAILTLTDAGGDPARPACVCVDGSLFKKSVTFRPALERLMDGFAAARLGRHSVFRTSEEATMLGSAAAALLNV